MKLKQIPRYTSIALIKQLALGSEVLAPIISVVIVRTVVTPAECKNMFDNTWVAKGASTERALLQDRFSCLCELPVGHLFSMSCFGKSFKSTWILNLNA